MLYRSVTVDHQMLKSRQRHDTTVLPIYLMEELEFKLLLSRLKMDSLSEKERRTIFFHFVSNFEFSQNVDMQYL